ncbi:hypothetical protein RRG08_047211 [Elysia crispata]|uniref:Uncharacterized protein n=1 Tax=Elysia crispata TaxID=231223 RepID=A0AAE1B8J8_9GAST|nr:hypothetical protein RRG08_047211 [Elysia crispata]
MTHTLLHLIPPALALFHSSSPNFSSNFCLRLLANSALNFSSVCFYTLTISCTDDVEAVITQDMSVTI